MNAATTDIDPDLFVSAVQPILESKNFSGLLEFLKSRWTGPQILSLIRGHHEDARKVAALCLTLVGTPCCVPEIAKLLKDSDPTVNQIAEHALWAIWLRSGGSNEANHQLGRGAQALERRDFMHALSHFDRALALSPEFAEAYNQRAHGHYLLEEYEEAMKDWRRAVELMPCHFGAWAGLGNAYAHLGDLDRAVGAFEQALAVNPHMHSVSEALTELRAKIDLH